MTTEVTMLVGCVLIFFVLTVVQASAGTVRFGMWRQLGNRDDNPNPDGFHARASRAVANHVEGLAIFTPLALAAVALNGSNATTVLGSQMFFAGRLAHAGFYLAGTPVARTVAFMLSTVGWMMVAYALF